MTRHGNHLDVSNNVDVTNPGSVNTEIGRIFAALYQEDVALIHHCHPDPYEW